jgi:transcriptional regulator with XRE-family HTH domain
MDASISPIRAYRLKQVPPMKLGDLAKRIRTSKGNLSRIETGKQLLSEELLRRVVTETGIPAHRLRPDLAEVFTRRATRGGVRAA